MATPTWLFPYNGGAFPCENTPSAGALNTDTKPGEGGGVSAPAQLGSGLQAPQEFNDLTAYKAKHVVDMVTIPPSPATDDQFKWIVLEGTQAITVPDVGANGVSATGVGIPLGAVSATNVLTQCLIPARYLQEKTYGWVFGLQPQDGVQNPGSLVAYMPSITVTLLTTAALTGLSATVRLQVAPTGTAPSGKTNAVGPCQLVGGGSGADAANPFLPGFTVFFTNGTAAAIATAPALLSWRILFPVPVNPI